MKKLTLFIVTGFFIIFGNLRAEEIQHKPAWSQADAIYGEEVMSASRHHLRSHHGADMHTLFMFDRLEYVFDDEEQLLWDWQGWLGGDSNKLWIKSEGEYGVEESELHEADIQLLWSHAISRFFDLQAGIRFDIEPDEIVHAVIGLQGLAPYWFETDTALFLSERGDLTAAIELEYELLLTQRLILQPRFEMGFSMQTIEERELGAGITDASIGIRLRYELAREFAPYLGIEWKSLIGNTRNLSEGEKEDLSFVAGLRIWY